MTGRKLHNYRCLLIGITDPDTVEDLWRKAEALRAREKPAPRRRRRARG